MLSDVPPPWTVGYPQAGLDRRAAQASVEHGWGGSPKWASLHFRTLSLYLQLATFQFLE